MFTYSELNLIETLIKNQPFSIKLSQDLQQQSNVEQQLLTAKTLRQTTTATLHYIVNSSTCVQHQQAYLLAPFVLANLNKNVIYHCPKSAEITQILKNYYSATSLDQHHIATCLDALNVYLNLEDTTYSQPDFFYASLLQALCRADVTHIFVITDLTLCPKSLEQCAVFFQVKISWIKSTEHRSINNEQTSLDLNQLLFKHKTPEYIKRCTEFSKINAVLLMQCDAYSQRQSEHLVEDMLYSEHVHERLSVYGEYMQTRQQHQKSML